MPLYCVNVTWSSSFFVEATDRIAARDFAWEMSGDFMDQPDVDIDVVEDEKPWDSAEVVLLDEAQDSYDTTSGKAYTERD